MSITIRVRELRETGGWCPYELVNTACVRQATLSAIERGETKGIDFETLERLALAFEAHPAVLIEWQEPPGRKQR